MKTKNLVLLLCCILTISFCATSCKCKTKVIHTNSNGIPPGQAKKITGSKSAKPYAPGQQKK